MKTNNGRGYARLWLLMVLLACVSVVQAQTRAWLDRDSINQGETVTLNIETDQAGAPDYRPLQADFEVSGHSSNRQMQMGNGGIRSSALFGVVLKPRRSGTLNVPALQVGSALTTPLQLVVREVAVATRGSNALAFIETEVDDPQPYVQQSVGVVVRLYFATQLASGELVLDTPAGASLQRVGDDRTSTRDVGGRRYNVVERRFLLIPERSGPLVVAGARFSGKGVGGFFDDFFERDSGQLSARAPDQTLQVQAIPTDAPQPWLPLKNLQLRYIAAPDAGRTGEAITFEVQATASGATKAQFPELPVPSLGDVAQVFAEPPQYDETFSGGSPQLTLKRRYSIVPQQAGALIVPGIRMQWWDVQAGQLQTAALPEQRVQVAQGSGGLVPPPLPQAAQATSVLDANALPVAPASGVGWLWPALAAGFALLWLVTLIWGLSRRQPAAPVDAPQGGERSSPGTTYSQTDLRRALDSGGLDEVVHILASMAGVADLDGVIARLDDAGQRQALERMQRARWAGEGDVSQARARLREVFRKGPRWSKAVATTAEKPTLDPLYPEQS
ncbi:BatD family protein [Stenotrophomonas sp. SY1]|uniref:BatD family protein n=1 Tax=Stenotrophomonas sp. SY1 TaxID=477235 RepID=UPI001E39B4D5|nr:BatD family protein [Stenotrophomonas sp. SY1]MCD9087990.1 BatD family protein [Stenotrophomonas sp. SY1]